MMSKEKEDAKSLPRICLYGWGFGKYFQLSLPKINYSLSPLLTQSTIPLITQKKDVDTTNIHITCGENHSAIYKDESSELYIFGKNTFGQLGQGNNSHHLSIRTLNVPESKNVTKVSLGGEHSIVITEEGEIYTTGLNYFGQLGVGDNENRNCLTKICRNNISEEEYFMDVCAGAMHSVFLTSHNHVYYSGYGKCMEKILGNEGADVNVPTLIKDKIFEDEEIISMSCGLNLTVLLFESYKSFLIFGEGSTKKLKFPELKQITIDEVDKDLPFSSMIKDIKVADDFCILLINTGDVYSVGTNCKGQLGTGKDAFCTNSNNFSKVPIPELIDEINVGSNFVIAIGESNRMYGWGSNQYGQLCAEESVIWKAQAIAPKALKKQNKIQLACGGYHVLGLFKGVPEKAENKLLDTNIQILSTAADIQKEIKKNNRLTDILENSEQAIVELKNKCQNLDKKLSKLKEKDKQIGVVPLNDLNSYTRGFENDFEIALDEITFDEENSQIGKGTFGDVLRGTWRGEDVAVKFLKNSMLDSEDSIRQFVDECNIMKNLHHPNILLYMGACTTGPQFFVVTEYCENGNLFEFLHINTSQKLTFEDARRIALEIAYGVNYLHGFKPPILHRDLKSMNVLLDRNLTVKLADFGNTKSLDVQMTKQKGTFQWMAPEVIRGNKYTEKSDVFSFGIIMNELVTRLPPYKGTDKKDVARKVVNNPEYRPPFNNKKVPKDWSDLMCKCWQHDENKRPTFNEIIDALTKAKMSNK